MLKELLVGVTFMMLVKTPAKKKEQANFSTKGSACSLKKIIFSFS